MILNRIVARFCFVALVVASTVVSAQTSSEPQLSPMLQKLPSDRMGPIVKLADGSYLTVDGTSAFTSTDGGATWTELAAILPSEGFKISNERALLRKRNGTLVLAFMNLATRSKEYWVKETNEFPADIRLEVWAVRSTDEGRTWTDAQCVQRDGYCGAIRTMIEAADGTIVLGAQNIVRDPSRHVITAYRSTDDGRSWQPATFQDEHGKLGPHFDIGGHGHHDGAIEPTMIALKDGRLWMLIRTGHDFFWQTYSADHGATWSFPQKSEIGASSAPGMLHRLADGRIALVWNRLYPEGKNDYERKEMPWHKVPSCYHREELSLATSGDEGATWSKPTVIARRGPGQWVSYPYLFEPTPGELWITTMQGGLRAKMAANDF